MESQPKRRGRKPKENALTGAERVKAHRARKQAAAVATHDEKPENVIARLRASLEATTAKVAELMKANNELNRRLAEVNERVIAAERETDRLRELVPIRYRSDDSYPGRG